MKPTRGLRRRVEGIVTSNRMQKTITVRVERLVKVPKYGKYVRRHTVCHAHDENQDARIGDLVELMATRPLSKTKCWRLVRVLRRASQAVPLEEPAPVAADGPAGGAEPAGAPTP